MSTKESLDAFHPIVKEWFLSELGEPSLPQLEGWPEIQAGRSVLLCAPTGAGKTLAAFLESLDRLLKLGLDNHLPQGVFILYVSPLKALNNDIYKNLEVPLEGIRRRCENAGLSFPEITKAVRTGDTPQAERQKMLKKPPHILITTPESLYLMLTSKKSCEILKNTKYLIVDEIHTMLGTKRGVHLALSLERLQALADKELVRIGLSATVHPLEAAVSYLGGLKKEEGGPQPRPVTLVSPIMERAKELSIYMPVADFRSLETGTIWPEIYESLYKLACAHETTIVFVNNRAVAEKVAANLNSLAGEEFCMPHHGSLSRHRRLEVEDQFKKGRLKCIIATSTLELGIDIGSIDLMVQVAAPLTVSGGLQRLGRAGHRLNAVSMGRIIPKTRTDLLKSVFMAQEMLAGRLEEEKIPENSLDILAQHIVSMCCQKSWSEEELLEVIRGAWSYRRLPESDFKSVLAMLAGDYEHLEDIPAKPRIVWDRVNHTLEGASYSKMLAVNSGGTIPDRGYFSVMLADHKTRVGELDEVFVFESRIGDRFMLGNSAWKIEKIEKDRVVVSSVSSVGARTPFWQGDGIGCAYNQGQSYGRFLRELAESLEEEDFVEVQARSLLMDETAALNIKNVLLDQIDALGCLSHEKRIVVEYLKDDVAEQRIILHAHFGGRVNSVLAILLQKALEDLLRCQIYCSHSNDVILLHVYGCPDSLTNVLSLLSEDRVEQTLIEMLPTTPRFAMTFRYTAYRALMMGVRNIGQRLPLWVQRLRSVDALENASKFRDHPLIVETMRECLEFAFDIPNTIRVLRQIREGQIQVIEKNTWYPSPFASEVLLDFKGFMMYMEKAPHPGEIKKPFISGIEALNLNYREEEAPPFTLEAVNEIGLKNSAPEKLRTVASSQELHSFLLIYGDIHPDEIPNDTISQWLELLIANGRAIRFMPGRKGSGLYIAAEEEELYLAAGSFKPLEEDEEALEEGGTWTPQEALSRIVRRFSRYHSPFSLETLLSRYALSPGIADRILYNHQAEGLLRKGPLGPGYNSAYCHIKVYESILRKDSALKSQAIPTRSASFYAGFLPLWQKVGDQTVSKEQALLDVLGQLEGLPLPVEYWETLLFPARVGGYSPQLLDKLCTSGRIFWRIRQEGTSPLLAWYLSENNLPSLEPTEALSPSLPEDMDNKESTQLILRVLKSKGACFTHILSALTGIQTSRLLELLEDLVWKGLIGNDSFSSIRFFLSQKADKKGSEKAPALKARRIAQAVSRGEMGRWELVWPMGGKSPEEQEDRLFKRYGLLCREAVAQEKSPYGWNELYESLKRREYADKIMRGYFAEGLSGIQFMLPAAYALMDGPFGYKVLNACDPAQAYGKILPRSLSPLPFTTVPSTALVLREGIPAAVFEKYGERIIYEGATDALGDILDTFVKAFRSGRIWPDRKKILVKEWPESQEETSSLMEALSLAGFKREIMRMVLWRQP